MEREGLKKESLLKGAASNYLSLGANVLVGLALTPFIISHLGKTGYGIWALISTFIGYYGLLDLGISSAVQRYVALHRGQGDQEALNQTISTALAIFFCTGALIIGASFVLSDPVAGFFQVAAAEVNDFQSVFRIIGITIALTFPTNVFAAIITGHEKFVVLNYVTLSTILLRAVLIVAALSAGAGIVALALANLAGQIFKLCVNFINYKRIMPAGQVRLKFVRRGTFRKIVYFGGVATVIMIANQMRTALDRIIVGKWVGLAEVGVYAIAAQITEYIMTVVIQGMNVLTPRFASLKAVQEREQIQKIFGTALHISAFLAFGFCMGALLFGEDLIELWVGKEFTDAKYILWILSIGFVFDLAQHPGIPLMFALNRHYLYAMTIVGEAVAKIVISLLLVSRYGMIGAALGTAVPMVITRIFIQPVYVSRLLGISVFEYGKPLLIQFSIACFLTGAFSSLPFMRTGSNTAGTLFGLMILVSFVYVMISLVFMDKTGKQSVRGLLFRKLSGKAEPNL
jgi:O-antigen/teichoic acid export membrane protein